MIFIKPRSFGSKWRIKAAYRVQLLKSTHGRADAWSLAFRRFVASGVDLDRCASNGGSGLSGLRCLGRATLTQPAQPINKQKKGAQGERQSFVFK